MTVRCQCSVVCTTTHCIMRFDCYIVPNLWHEESIYISLILFHSPASVHSQSEPEPEPRLADATSPGSNLNGSTITVTPSSSYDVYCSLQGIPKNWYRSSTSVSRNTDQTHDPNVYVSRIVESGIETLALRFKSFRPSDIGKYECKITTPSAHPTTTVTLSVYLSEYILCFMH